MRRTVLSALTGGGRGLAVMSRAQARRRENLARLKQAPSTAGAEGAASTTAPTFSALLRQLYKKTHPDLLRSKCATSAEHNDKQWQLLNGILSTIKEGGAYPPAINQHVKLFMAGPAGLEPVELRIQTAGGDCEKALTRSFAELFTGARLFSPGAEHVFAWDADYFKREVSGRAGPDY